MSVCAYDHSVRYRADTWPCPHTPFGAPHRFYEGSRYRTRALQMSQVSDRMYFNLKKQLAESDKIRNYRRAQRHVLNLYPDALRGIASSRIQFFVMRPKYFRGEYTRVRSYISKHAWEMEMGNLAECDTVGIEVRGSDSVTESVSSFFNLVFNRARFKL